MHPPHSTVLRREEGKGIHIQLTDRNLFIILQLLLFIYFFYSCFSCSFDFHVLCLDFTAVTSWPRLDNDAPSVLERCGSNSPTEVVGTMSEGCDLLEQSTGFLVGYPRAPFASVVTPLVAGLPCVSSPLETHRRVLWGTLLGTWGRAPGLLRDGEVGKPSREGVRRPPPGPPQKGGSGTPPKGGVPGY